MEVTAEYAGGVAFEVATRGHRIISDQPKDNSGADAGMSPPEAAPCSVGDLRGILAVQYLITRGLPADGVAVRVVAGKALKPARLADFRIEVTVPAVDEGHEAAVARAVKACLIHNTC